MGGQERRGGERRCRKSEEESWIWYRRRGDERGGEEWREEKGVCGPEKSSQMFLNAANLHPNK